MAALSVLGSPAVEAGEMRRKMAYHLAIPDALLPNLSETAKQFLQV